MGLNLKFAPQNTALCDIEISLKDLVSEFLQKVEKFYGRIFLASIC